MQTIAFAAVTTPLLAAMQLQLDTDIAGTGDWKNLYDQRDEVEDFAERAEAASPTVTLQGAKTVEMVDGGIAFDGDTLSYEQVVCSVDGDKLTVGKWVSNGEGRGYVSSLEITLN